jgi:hypothetical protein
MDRLTAILLVASGITLVSLTFTKNKAAKRFMTIMIILLLLGLVVYYLA